MSLFNFGATAPVVIENIQLSKNFSLEEMCKSSTADRLGIDNWPTEIAIVEKLTATSQHILQPVRDHYKRSMVPNSGYRCMKLNRKLKSKDTSQHPKGEAVDFEVPGRSNYDVAIWCRDNLDFDQLILEMYNPAQGPSSGWVHCSYVSSAENRKEVLTIFSRKSGGGAFQGIHQTRP